MKLNARIKSLTPYLMVVVFLGLQACSGGGGGGTTAVTDANPIGYYTGSAAVKTDGNNALDFAVADLQIMISGTRIMIMSDAQALLYDGTFTVSGNDLTSTVTIYHNGDKKAATATLNATITEGSQLTGTFTGTELGNGTFVSTYSTLNNTASALTQVNNNRWQGGLNEAAVTGYEFQVNNAGGLSDSNAGDGATFNGCNTTGGAYLPITGSSLFSVTLIFSTCVNAAVEGTYTGFSQLKTTTTLALTVSNGTYAFADDFFRN